MENENEGCLKYVLLLGGGILILLPFIFTSLLRWFLENGLFVFAGLAVIGLLILLIKGLNE